MRPAARSSTAPRSVCSRAVVPIGRNDFHVWCVGGSINQSRFIPDRRRRHRVRQQGDAELRPDPLSRIDKEVSLLAFDLLEFGGTDIRKRPLVERKELLADLLKKLKDGIELNVVIKGDPAIIFEHACKLGHEGIVVKRKDLPYESGRSKRWLKTKNPASPAMKRVEDGTF